ncbi:flagellin lysine-N-methylase [Telmatobacter bradus]|uniref:flagellin lysine-N-methylase n=1 Tax=Telmatobacter bradus TaxID=474953 RepID=UPI003B4330E3
MEQAYPAVTYATQFACIGADCEDTCCGGWTVPVDQPAFDRFQQLPPSQLKTDLLASIELKNAPSPHFAVLRMKEDHSCPLLTSNKLCSLHATHGAEMLANTCRQYPRYSQSINGQTEISLALSCPEAARLVLLHPALLEQSTLHDPLAFSATPEADADTPLLAWAGPVRRLVLWIVAGQQNYPLWQRMFLLRILCHRLDALHANNTEERIPALLADFHSRILSGTLRASMDRLPASTEVQLDAVLQLAGLLLSQSNLTPRFLECVHAFTTGIGNGPGATLASLSAGYDRARDQWLAPFLVQQPKMLENWLVNAILCHRFPFGSLNREDRQATSAVDQFEALAANFALMRGLLTGVAGFHRDNFSSAHAIHTMQSASRHFEHHPDFLPKARTLLRTAGLNDLHGMSKLLNDAPLQKRFLVADRNPEQASLSTTHH